MRSHNDCYLMDVHYFETENNGKDHYLLFTNDFMVKFEYENERMRTRRRRNRSPSRTRTSLHGMMKPRQKQKNNMG